MKFSRFAHFFLSVLIATTSATVAEGAIVWHSDSGFGPMFPQTSYARFKFAAYATHNSLSDDLAFDTYGVIADIGYAGNVWDGMADHEDPVTDANINQRLGNGGDVPIVDGFYWMQRWLLADGNDIDYVNVGATCYEYYQDCGPKRSLKGGA